MGAAAILKVLLPRTAFGPMLTYLGSKRLKPLLVTSRGSLSSISSLPSRPPPIDLQIVCAVCAESTDLIEEAEDRGSVADAKMFLREAWLLVVLLMPAVELQASDSQ